MKSENGRNPWLAGFLGCSMVGLGQVYNGELLKGTCFFIISVLTVLAGVRASLMLSDTVLFLGLMGTGLLALFLHAVMAAEAVIHARRLGRDFQPKAYNRWYFYTAAWMAGALFVLAYFPAFLKTHYVEFFKAASSSMEPAVRKGDYLIADYFAYKRMSPKKGDVIVFVYPDDRSKVFLKRIAALPGETVTLENGGAMTVPHGTVFVLADKSHDTIDSRIFGPVPLADVKGKVRQVYFSRGKDGIRWSRIGKSL